MGENRRKKSRQRAWRHCLDLVGSASPESQLEGGDLFYKRFATSFATGGAEAQALHDLVFQEQDTVRAQAMAACLDDLYAAGWPCSLPPQAGHQWLTCCLVCELTTQEADLVVTFSDVSPLSSAIAASLGLPGEAVSLSAHPFDWCPRKPLDELTFRVARLRAGEDRPEQDKPCGNVRFPSEAGGPVVRLLLLSVRVPATAQAQGGPVQVRLARALTGLRASVPYQLMSFDAAPASAEVARLAVLDVGWPYSVALKHEHTEGERELLRALAELRSGGKPASHARVVVCSQQPEELPEGLCALGEQSLAFDPVVLCALACEPHAPPVTTALFYEGEHVEAAVARACEFLAAQGLVAQAE